ncbi:MAG: cystathionine gamma-synthase [Chlorobi bacterium]|nr:cystathionine gamma-synthase [Chlorobiota bacterium]
MKNQKFETNAIHVGEKPNIKEGGSGDVISPIHLSTTFARQDVDIPTAGYEYSRSLNPTRKALEAKLAALENAKYALAFSSGMAAETSLLLALLQTGNHVIATDDLYGGTQRLFLKVFQPNYNINFSLVNTGNSENIANSLQENTKLLWLESPTNPLLKISDIANIARTVKSKGVITVVDNTFMSPYFQNPLNLGADIVLHSTSKYINGHSDSIGGAIMTNNKDIYEKIQFIQNSVGAIMSPFDSYMVLRGIKTLAARMKVHGENAIQIANFLNQHPKVKKVIYPGLTSHPQHEIAKKQMKGFGGMISIELDGGINEAKKFVSSLNYFALAESLGGVESLIELPAPMTHASVPEKTREKLGITDSLVRISVGIENQDDLINDLKQALDKI